MKKLFLLVLFSVCLLTSISQVQAAVYQYSDSYFTLRYTDNAYSYTATSQVSTRYGTPIQACVDIKYTYGNYCGSFVSGTSTSSYTQQLNPVNYPNHFHFTRNSSGVIENIK